MSPQRQFASPPSATACAAISCTAAHRLHRVFGFFPDRQRIDLVDVAVEPADGPVVDLPDVTFDLSVSLTPLAQVARHVQRLGRLARTEAAGDQAQGLVVDELHRVDGALERLPRPSRP